MKKYTWKVLAKKSTIRFNIKYFQISNISGSFLKFDGEIIAEEDFQNPEIYLEIEADSIQTHNKESNFKIKSPLLLFTDNYPIITFRSKFGCKQSIGKIWELTGILTIKDTDHLVTMVINHSEIKPHSNQGTATFHLFGNILRSEFNIQYEYSSELSDEINLTLVIHLVRQ
ncbi:hypothetical protein Dfri01_46870 [Dyadobacter frigoris]|uniref:YceI family protein n=1 Tax=Dyadobacter frigoris TaxID=2576211 RepID=UPI0024A166EF|nr:YceI family protein [Dyadobacter frigoris]GLU55226.1 hypothetical protein Dfri01_46870 [Dyadobacter frigoris]